MDKDKLITTKTDFQYAMSKFHLSKPYLHINFQDNFSDNLKEKWQKMDKAILEVIWQISKENDIDTNEEKIY